MVLLLCGCNYRDTIGLPISPCLARLPLATREGLAFVGISDPYPRTHCE